MREVIAFVIMGIGVTFDFLGCLGLVRLPDLYNRLQASTKCVTLGTILIMAGVIVFTGWNQIGVKALLTLLFILITSPTAAHALARGAYKAGVKLWDKSVCDQYGGEEQHEEAQN
ncbi:MAG TPA: Na+/H+ antiporter subunit G [bacterium]|nr:Na+/H+ antiporter subunit G [bacterium]HEX68533.1 Na+/H+ antiporter subunit G [bacterium]